ncbi:odorant receptor 131-2-like [Boleophthalmus pectinirostris]|uniref:odorant receptor 131-2-like n=1 Tax=Boleophthalmus pectinirostris TaxID=150288 RepID=UPI00242B3AD4|nr:odorant receptor 131-2-like [Boleophthalmus pectinirostris]
MQSTENLSNQSDLPRVSVNESTVVIYRDTFVSSVAKNVLLVSLGLTINFINGTLIHTYRKHQIFYTNPRYILFAHLVVNDMFQLSLTISLFVLSYTSRQMPCPVCLILLCLSVLTTHNIPLNLAVMAVECYIAVCFPLHHPQLCTIQRTYGLIAGIWALTTLIILPDIFILVVTKPPEFFVSTVYCERANVFGHPVIMMKRDVQYIVYLSGVWFILIYTYCHIFFAARAVKSSAQDSRKARNTILLHGFQLLLCMLSYVDHLLVRVLMIWFLQYIVHIAFVIYVIVMVLPRLISPILYGLRDKVFREHFTKYLVFTVVIKS